MTHPLTKFREANRLSQPELARLLEVDRSLVFRWENGERKIGETLLPRIAERTGIPAKELRPDLLEKHEKLFGEAQ